MGLSGVVCLIFSGCSRVSLPAVCVRSLVVFGFYPLVANLSVCSLLQGCFFVFAFFGGVHNSHLILYMIQGRAKMEWIMTAGEYSVGFKVPTCRAQIGDSLEKYSNNHDISSN